MSEKTPKPKAKKAAAETKPKKAIPAVAPVEEKAEKAEKPITKKSSVRANRKTAATIKKFQSHGNDTGSTDVQVAVLTEKITSLTKHLQSHKKDHDSRMGLLKMIGQRRSLLNYLEKKNNERYKKLIANLGLRK